MIKRIKKEVEKVVGVPSFRMLWDEGGWERVEEEVSSD